MFESGSEILRLEDFQNYNQFSWNAYWAPSIGPDASHPHFRFDFLHFFFTNYGYFFFWLLAYMTQYMLEIIAGSIKSTFILFSCYSISFFDTYHRWKLGSVTKKWESTYKIKLKVTYIWSNRGRSISIS